MTSMHRLVFLLLLWLYSSVSFALEGLPATPPALPQELAAGSAPHRSFLLPEQAFNIQVMGNTGKDFTVRFNPAPGYYLYRDRIKMHTIPDQAMPALRFPTAESKQDPSFGLVWVYHHPFEVAFTAPNPLPETLAITYQGCADQGICYPPTTLNFTRLGNTDQYRSNGLEDTLSSAPDKDSANPIAFANYLKDAKPLWVLASFFGFGLLLALTPCLFPMIPILSGIIAGQGSQITKSRAFGLSLTYVLGMALTYAAAGVLAGLSGTLLSNVLQTPAVQIASALLFAALALSMFDLYQLQLPLALQNRLNGASGRLPGGKHLGVGLMGALSALVMGPCVAAPLAGGLLYIAQTRNVVLGGSALFVMALGMGSPLLAIGTSAGALLPRAGHWMVWVKRFFGVLLLGVALWIVMPLLGSRMGVGAPAFTPIHSNAELDAAVREATAQHRPVMLDFYADWCVSCVEMDQKVFTNPDIKTLLARGVLLRADVTHNTLQDKALLNRFGLFGPPGTLFFDAHGQEIENARLAGFVAEPQFKAHLQRYF